MNPNQYQSFTIEDVEELIEDKLKSYETKIQELEKELAIVLDEQAKPAQKVDVRDRELLHVGAGYMASITGRPTAGRDALLIAVGSSRDEALDKKYQLTQNSAIAIVHNDANSPTGSYLVGEAGGSIVNLTGNATINGSTITDKTLNLTENELVSGSRKFSCYIEYDDGTPFEAFQITSNTKNTITLSGVPKASGSLKYFIPSHLYLGWTTQPFQRAYVREGAAGGVRFGLGGTTKEVSTEPLHTVTVSSNGTNEVTISSTEGSKFEDNELNGLTLKLQNQGDFIIQSHAFIPDDEAIPLVGKDVLVLNLVVSITASFGGATIVPTNLATGNSLLYTEGIDLYFRRPNGEAVKLS